jgi:glycosyltransferase involved in cell wall biosynthesis
MLVGLVHHPLALETGLTEAQARSLRASEKAALAAAKHVVVTSAATAQRLIADYSVPGQDHSRKAGKRYRGIGIRKSRWRRAYPLGWCVVPRKGFDVLVAALATLPDLPWRLTIAGDRGRDARAAAQLDGDIARLRLGERVTVLGAVSAQRIAELYAEATYSPSPRGSRATAWPTVRRSRTGCRLSAQGPEQSRYGARQRRHSG